MHELAIAESVVSTVLERTGGRVSVVRLRVGRLSGVVPDALLFCVELAAACRIRSRVVSEVDGERVTVTSGLLRWDGTALVQSDPAAEPARWSAGGQSLLASRPSATRSRCTGTGCATYSRPIRPTASSGWKRPGVPP